MFFRMLKNDLKAKKGLNLIVFIFMIAAAALVFVGTVQLYAVITGSSYTDRMCKAYNSYFYVKEENEEKARGVMDQHPMVNDYTVSRACVINNTLIDFDHPGFQLRGGRHSRPGAGGWCRRWGHPWS